MKSSPAIKRIRRSLLNKKIGTFLVCLGIASLLWVVHTLNKNYKYTLHISVKFLNLPANKLIIGELPEYLDVEIKASGLKLIFIALKKNTDDIILDFNSLKNNAKSQAYSISNGNLNIKQAINFDVDILKIRPDTLFFSSNKGNTKLLPVRANLKVKCQPGYSIISKPIISPAYVSVTGDSADLKKMDTVYTYFLNLKGINQNFSSPVLLKKPYSSISYHVKDVQVSFTVDKLTEAAIQIPIQVMNNTDNKTIKLLPKFVTITYLVAMKAYETISASSFKAVVNYDHIKAKQSHLKVELVKVPSEVTILKTEPNNISYLIYK